MKIYCPNNSKQSIGGGWTFLNNFIKGGKSKFEVVNSWKECDIVLITGVTMTERQEMQDAKDAGKKIVLRVDNMPKDSRNRGTAFSRMRDFGIMADYIIFQSEWAKDYVGWYLDEKCNAPAMDWGIISMGEFKDIEDPIKGKGAVADLNTTENNSVIYNGIDTDFFYYKDKPHERRGNVYLYVQYNRDENKRFPEAAMYFHNQVRRNKDIELWCVGNFTPELVKYNFDFFANEDVSYIEPISDRGKLGEVMRKAKYLLFPAYADASPNTVAEAMACGAKVLCTNPCGGTDEVIAKHLAKPYTIQEMANDYYEIFKKL